VQELVVNIIKHADAQRARVTVVRDAERIRIEVEDYGVGFDVSKLAPHSGPGGGFGLFSIRERPGHLGGRVDLQSAPGHGTKVTLVAPLAHVRTMTPKFFEQFFFGNVLADDSVLIEKILGRELAEYPAISANRSRRPAGHGFLPGPLPLVPATALFLSN
jgi:hypothetical protein